MRNQDEYIAEQNSHIERQQTVHDSLIGELDQTTAQLAERWHNGSDGEHNPYINPIFDSASQGVDMSSEHDIDFDCDSDCKQQCNPLYNDQESSGITAAVMQVETRSVHSRAPTEMERLRRSAKDAKVRSPCMVTDGPVIDSATDTDVIGSRDAKHATNVLEHEPFKYSTICGEGETKLRGDLETPLVTLRSAPIVMTSHDSIVSNSTLHGEGFIIVSSEKGTSLVKDGIAVSAVPNGKMYRLPVAARGRVDDEVNYAVALHHKSNLARVLKKLQLHRKRMHRPADLIDCDVCPMLMNRRKAERLSPSATRVGEERGYVAGLDYITGLPPDNDGNTAILGFVVAS